MKPSTKRVAIQMLNKVPEVTIFFWIITNASISDSGRGGQPGM